ncbi:MAG: 1-acyl-sn-glycerol-3-phosphate acyltransferase [Saprospiraceae bacterium]|jgi:1-acyl-sn-glycerol-3-phosphate acyltransferase|nr:1-acyl-sn-glycerol-3-phosphate acyltransferase [Saprospiraceae bacterium]MBP9210586.1 1-acyl-sn-glycerol-3-phosphate acyltransferase [Saprospiraceae bacterium]MBV6473600.1 hypothetical protein [Saprospiraceae bacterium]
MFYRRIWVYGNARIPRTGAVLFIANHPKSFMDASLVACFQHRVLNTLIRGDMFDKRWLRPLLRAVHQIPIFRRKDGFTNLKKNKGTFDACYQVFARKEALLIFPEASTMMVPYLRPLQKGAARLAIGTLEGEFSKELWVIPTGIFYAEPTRSRSDIAIHFGEPVSVSGWMEENRNCDDKIAALTEHFQEAMEKCVVSARQEGHDVLFYRLLGMLEPVLLPFTRPGLIREDMPWKTLMHIAGNFSAMDRNELDQLEAQLAAEGDPFVCGRSLQMALFRSPLFRLAFLCGALLTFAGSLAAIVVYGLPLLLARAIARKAMKHVEFYAPVRLAASMIFHLVVTLAIGAYIGVLIGFWGALVAVAMLQMSLLCWCAFADVSKYLHFACRRQFIHRSSALIRLRNSLAERFSKN